MALNEYTGEEIIANIVIKQGKKHEHKVWMPRTVSVSYTHLTLPTNREV